MNIMEFYDFPDILTRIDIYLQNNLISALLLFRFNTNFTPLSPPPEFMPCISKRYADNFLSLFYILLRNV